MSEISVQKKIQTTFGKLPDIRLFRNNVGQGFQGKPQWLESGNLLLKYPRRINFGLCKGSSDLIGFRRRTITQDMVGQSIAQFVALEVKNHSRAKRRDDQQKFTKITQDLGALSGFCWSVENARRVLFPDE
jgi:hypothetical protein